MRKFLRLTAAISATAITVFGSTGVALAQNRDDYVNVGEDSDGNPILLDLTTIREASYELLSRYGDDGIYKAKLDASCAEKRLFVSEVVIYSAEGRTLGKNRNYKEMSVSPNSAAYNSMGIVCRRIGAPGWGGM